MFPTGIKDPKVLLKSMKPKLIEGEFVFSTIHGSLLASFHNYKLNEFPSSLFVWWWSRTFFTIRVDKIPL